MVRILFNEDSFEVDMQGIEKVEAMKGKLVIPYSHIERVDEDASEIVTGFKLIGTELTPSSHDYGTFRTNEGEGFYALKHKDRAFAIHLRDEHYSVLVLQLENNADAIEGLRIRMTSR